MISVAGQRKLRTNGSSSRHTARGLGATALAAAVAAALAPGMAHAQDISATASTGNRLEEVVVTATRRSENVQNVPIAISAFTTETLRNRGVTDITSLSNITPNVNLDGGSPFSGDTSVLSASIRGIGSDDFAFNIDPGVGVYVDGVFLARSFGANQNLLDVERVEILRGPQGTLFGRNTIGGAINIVTHDPGTEPSFVGQATMGSYDRLDMGFTADLPITDNLLSSLTFSSIDREGYQKVIPYPSDSLLGSTPFIVDPMNAYPRAGYDTAEKNGGLNQTVARGKLKWILSDDVKVTFAADYNHQDQPSTAATVVSVNDGAFFGSIYNACISTPADVLNAGGGFLGPAMNTGEWGLCGPRANHTPELGGTGGAALGGAGYVSGPNGNNLLSSTPRIYWNLANTQTGDIDKTYANGVSFAKNDGYGLAMTWDWDLGNNMQFKSITGYREIDWRVGIDLDGTPESVQEVTDHQEQEQFSQEFQLLGKMFDDKLDYVFGLYYFTEEGFVHDYVPFLGLLYVYDLNNDVDTTSYAAFLHADYAFTDKFSVIFGGRYTHDDKDFVGGQMDLNGFDYRISGCNPPDDPAYLHLDPTIPPFLTCQDILGYSEPGQPFRYFPSDKQNQTFSVFTPTLGLQYSFNDDLMGYVKYSEGFKSGGWTTRLSAPISDGSFAEYKPEYADSYEAGLKAEMFDNHLLVNTAVFYTDYKDIQLNEQVGASPILRNAGSATLQGIEVESQASFESGLGFYFAFGYIDAEYDSIGDTVVGITRDNKLPKTPEFSVNFGPTFDFGLANGGAMRLSADYTHTDDMYNDSLNTADLKRPSVDNLNAAIRYVSPSQKYEFVVGGTNLTDERFLVTGSINEAAGEHVGNYNRPREYYGTVRVKFD